MPNKAWFTPLKSKNCAEQRREVFSVFSNRRKQDRCAYSLRVVWLVEGFGRIDLGDASDAGGSLRVRELEGGQLIESSEDTFRFGLTVWNSVGMVVISVRNS